MENPSQAQPVFPDEDDPGVMERIRSLLSKHYSPKQIKEKYGYAPRTVDQVAEEFIEPEGKGGDNGRDLELTVTVRDKKAITPEFIMHRLSDGSPDWQLRLDLNSAIKFRQR